MTKLAALATVKAACTKCRRRFTAPVNRLTVSGGMYCSNICRETAQESRLAARNGRTCAACGGPFGRVRHYGLEICMGCYGVAWQTCWRKRFHTTDPGVVVHEDGATLRSYRCPLCPFWHLTKDFCAPPREFLDAQVRLARLFAEMSFDIDRYRVRRPGQRHQEGPTA